MYISFLKKKLFLAISIIIFIGVFLRIYNLDWGAPFYFHPDERNIASSVSQLHFPNQLNPHFYAYGLFPIYSIYFLGIVLNILDSIFQLSSHDIFSVPFEKSIFASRIFSAFFSIILIPLVFFIGREIKNNRVGFTAATFTTLSVGLIQFAHFGTFETWTTFFAALLFFLCLKVIAFPNWKYILLLASISGVVVAIKVSNVPLLIVPLLAISYGSYTKYPHVIKKNIVINSRNILFFLFLTCISFVLLSIYIFVDFKSFQESMKYESSVALGTLPVFYTGGFFDTKPVVYHFLYIYPFLLNPFLTIVFIFSWSYYIFRFITKKINHKIFFLILSWSVLFFSQSFLFVKWTRYMVPTLPFMYLLSILFINEITILIKKKNSFYTLYPLFFFFIFSFSIFYTFSFAKTVLFQKDSRIDASRWAKQNIPTDSKIISEVYDLGIVPFNPSFPFITLFNFYELDTNTDITQQELYLLIKDSNYYILPSQRIFRNRINNPNHFPFSYQFYSKLNSNTSQFEKIYETPCDIFCKILYFGDPIFHVEETANVFDRPIVTIYKKK